jgi:hypothetical protein
MIWTSPPNDRPEGGWCVGAGRQPHYVQSGELIRTPPTTGVPLCPSCHRKHHDRLEDREPRR